SVHSWRFLLGRGDTDDPSQFVRTSEDVHIGTVCFRSIQDTYDVLWRRRTREGHDVPYVGIAGRDILYPEQAAGIGVSAGYNGRVGQWCSGPGGSHDVTDGETTLQGSPSDRSWGWSCCLASQLAGEIGRQMPWAFLNVTGKVVTNQHP